MDLEPVLIDGTWSTSDAAGSFQASNPATGEDFPECYPISSWNDLNTALTAAAGAFHALRAVTGDQRASFLDAYADNLNAAATEIAARAHEETALPVSPRLLGVELPRTANQLRLAAEAARDGSWALPTIDTASGIRSCLAPLGPVAVFGPNNFPLAFNGIAGGDFAAAIATGNPVIAKAHPSHPATSKLLAGAARAALETAGLPPATVQMVYKMNRDVGCRMAADKRLAAIGYTGSRAGGLALKEVCDRHGKPAFLELSSINPVVILPGALAERSEKIVDEFVSSCLMGTGQFCTNPGLVLALAGSETDRFVSAVAEGFRTAPDGTLLNKATEDSLRSSVETLRQAGAEVLVGGKTVVGEGCCFANTLLSTSAARFLDQPEALQQEAFGNASLVVVCDDVTQLAQVVDQLEGNLTGCVYSDTAGTDDEAYHQIEPSLRQKVGRLLNDKMPTGVAVSPAMNHGGPYPATGHPHFTAVGIPASLRRFTMLQSFDNVRPSRLPPCLADEPPHARMWRLVDGQWRQGNVT